MPPVQLPSATGLASVTLTATTTRSVGLAPGRKRDFGERIRRHRHRFGSVRRRREQDRHGPRWQWAAGQRRHRHQHLRECARLEATIAGAGNIIAYSGTGTLPPNAPANEVVGIGVAVLGGSGNAILGNSIYANTVNGIFILGNANNGQKPPVETSVLRVNSSITIDGTVASTPDTVIRVEFFSNPSDSSIPEGKTFLGFVDVTTDASGNGAFTLPRPRLFLRSRLSRPRPLTRAATARVLGLRHGEHDDQRGHEHQPIGFWPDGDRHRDRFGEFGLRRSARGLGPVFRRGTPFVIAIPLTMARPV